MYCRRASMQVMMSEVLKTSCVEARIRGRWSTTNDVTMAMAVYVALISLWWRRLRFLPERFDECLNLAIWAPATTDRSTNCCLSWELVVAKWIERRSRNLEVPSVNPPGGRAFFSSYINGRGSRQSDGSALNHCSRQLFLTPKELLI